MNIDYGKAFRIVRAAVGLQQVELAARMSVTSSQLSLIESGKRNPSHETVSGLAKAAGVPASLITLLASSPDDLQERTDADELSRALLKLLTSGATRSTAS